MEQNLVKILILFGALINFYFWSRNQTLQLQLLGHRQSQVDPVFQNETKQAESSSLPSGLNLSAQKALKILQQNKKTSSKEQSQQAKTIEPAFSTWPIKSILKIVLSPAIFQP